MFVAYRRAPTAKTAPAEADAVIEGVDSRNPRPATDETTRDTRDNPVGHTAGTQVSGLDH
jgi:hypothetical protein